jgi:hypothetical protein
MIRRGDFVVIKPEFQDPGDDKYQWLAVDDESAGRVTISPVGTGLAIPPRHVVRVSMLENQERN